MDAATATLIGVAITGILALLGTMINNRYQLRLQREQWERQAKKEEDEHKSRANENAEDREAKYREMIQNMYVDVIQTLTTALIAFNTMSTELQINHIREV